MTDFIQEQFISHLQPYQLSFSDEQLQQFETYYRLLVQWNEKINLTAITERDQVYLKHFYDSLSLAFYVDMEKVETLADIGSGAGFPSIPLKIAFPHLKVTIVDSLNKRIVFLNELVKELGLTDVTCVHARAEDAARLQQHRDRYDLVTARAVARLSVLNEFCLPFVKVGGLFVAMKAADAEEEMKEAAFSIGLLKGRLKQVDRLELPVEKSVRHFIQIQKTAPTPGKYPRKAGLPLKQPLVK
ncbi:16S rRNA (guanine(527)-N(7))-methyltransferase RsmG [Paenibacillus chitinolyticus]|uniref:16S rRNA (guanine(527)-N(7))-methyltransferase RsmG n=1 Tax=Paenibacillus chitinolyticus TaxID=79263 RepID=UPI002DB96AA3|nr:16S rRNA (guanine(527)-N(7))-methyltransferase RsmG [Paenibacillus chitinolyticus]MEC0244487.1 16S rRNA (guanine(527)-N(7))-methyltransferase RsmG [Paenibacillus chitinolyticus]